MGSRVRATTAFLASVARDVIGTLILRWRRFYRGVVLGQPTVSVGVDIFPFFERMTGVGRYEWQLLQKLDMTDEDLQFNLYAHTFLAPDEPSPPPMPGSRRMRFRLHHMPGGFLLPIRPTIALLRGVIEPLLKCLDGNHVMFAPNFFVPQRHLPFADTVVATVHDLAFALMPNTVSPATLDELRRNLPPSLFRSERLIAVSDATAGDLTEHLGVSARRIHTIHEGIDPEFASEADPTDQELPERYILFVSTLEPRKNVVNILRAFELVVEWGYPGQLLMVGRWGWRTRAIADKLESSPVRDRIRHLDYVTGARLPSIYAGAEALVFPSVLEGFGLPILEAMACGLPVITAGLSAMPEVAGPAAVYVDPDKPHSIASGIASVTEDPQHRQRLGELGRRRAARFSWEATAAATAQVLRQAAGLPATAADEHRV